MTVAGQAVLLYLPRKHAVTLLAWAGRMTLEEAQRQSPERQLWSWLPMTDRSMEGEDQNRWLMG